MQAFFEEVVCKEQIIRRKLCTAAFHQRFKQKPNLQYFMNSLTMNSKFLCVFDRSVAQQSIFLSLNRLSFYHSCANHLSSSAVFSYNSLTGSAIELIKSNHQKIQKVF